MKTKIKFYSDHQIYYIRQTHNHVNHGIYKGYWPNGNIQHDYNYLDGMKHGKNDVYYENGLKHYERNFFKNLEVGLIKVWNKNGSRYSMFQNRRGIFNGTVIVFNYGN
jgi:antitoxin component YwqK of YwqJK toxin-antitoxin module